MKMRRLSEKQATKILTALFAANVIITIIDIMTQDEKLRVTQHIKLLLFIFMLVIQLRILFG